MYPPGYVDDIVNLQDWSCYEDMFGEEYIKNRNNLVEALREPDFPPPTKREIDLAKQNKSRQRFKNVAKGKR